VGLIPSRRPLFVVLGAHLVRQRQFRQHRIIPFGAQDADYFRQIMAASTNSRVARGWWIESTLARTLPIYFAGTIASSRRMVVALPTAEMAPSLISQVLQRTSALSFFG
jgi:hypothetical protein